MSGRALPLEKTPPTPAEARAAGWLEAAAQAIREIDAEAVEQAAALLVETRRLDGTIFVAGNGGSAGTASHLALDLQKAGRAPGGRGTRAISLADNVGRRAARGARPPRRRTDHRFGERQLA